MTKTAARVRLDQLLVERGLADSRSKAQALLLAGQVRVGEGDAARADRKPGDMVESTTTLIVDAPEAYVSRGGHKLALALDSFAIDRLAFLVCLIAPFRRFRSLLAVVMVLASLQAATLTVGAWGAVSDAHWLPPLLDTCFGIVIVLLAIENVVAPSLRRRWFVSAVIGALSGFGLAHVLGDHWQFAGAHPVLSLVSFNLGIALGEVHVRAVRLHPRPPSMFHGFPRLFLGMDGEPRQPLGSEQESVSVVVPGKCEEHVAFGVEEMRLPVRRAEAVERDHDILVRARPGNRKFDGARPGPGGQLDHP